MRLQCQLDEKNMNHESQGFFYQSDQAYGAQVNEIGLGNDNDEYVGGDDFDMQPQPNYLDFF